MYLLSVFYKDQCCLQPDMKNIFLVLLALVHVSAESVDQKATPRTVALHRNLLKIARDPNKILFGQHKATLSGAGGGYAPFKTHTYATHTSFEFKTSMVGSHHDDDLCDVKQVTGQYPAFIGFDFNQLDSDWMKIVTYLTKKAFEKGIVIEMAWHVNNFASGGNPWSFGNEQHLVRELKPGGKQQHKYKSSLDKIADWANTLVDSKGKHIPIIFRPFSESNAGWFWWGLGNKVNNTPKDLQDIYRFTVKYLRDTKGVHNFLYAYSPNTGYKSMTENGQFASYLAAYPGDDYVDILGLNDYTSVSKISLLQHFVDGLDELAREAEKRNKIPALTEVGLRRSHINDVHDFWQDYVLNSIKGTAHVQKRDAARRIAYMNTWTNYCGGGNCDLYTPFAGHPAAKYFVNFSKDPLMGFGNYVAGHRMYL